MKKIILFPILFVMTLSCTSMRENRSPSSDEEIDFSKVDVGLLEQIYRFALNNQAKYKILVYPARDPSHIENGAEAVEKMKKLKGIEEITDKFRNSLWDLLGTEADRSVFKRKIGDHVRPVILGRFNSSEKKKLIEFCFGPKGVGDYYDLAQMFTFDCASFNFLVTDNDIRTALRSIPNDPTGVRYDGQKGWHIYENKELEFNVQVLTLAIATEKKRFLEIFDAEEPSVKEKFRHNSHGMSEANKVEPFDLLTSYSTWNIIGQNWGESDYGDLNKVYIGKLVQKSMSRLFQMFERDPESDKLPTMSIMKKEDRALFWCANGRFNPREYSATDKPNFSFYRSYGNDILEGMVPSFQLSDLIEKRQIGFTFYCNTMEYKTTINVEEADEINPPKPINYSEQDRVDVLITVALVSEMTSSALGLGKLYLRTLGGWSIEEDFKDVDTEEEFERLLPSTDMYIPVSHAMDVNAFHVGTQKGISIKVSKKITANDGSEKTIYATILFPKTDGGVGVPVIMNPDSLSDLLLERTKLGHKQPLFLMNTSCGSEKTLFTWIATHRKLLEKKIKNGFISNIGEDTETPHIIGSKRYFSTDSTAAIMSHLSYPVGAMEMLTKGYSVPKVVEFLKKDQEGGFMNAISSFFGGESEEDEHTPKNFEPDYLMDHPELLKIGGYRIKVNRRGFPSEREY